MAFRLGGTSSAPAPRKSAPEIPMGNKAARMMGKQAPALTDVGGSPKPTRSRRDYGKTTAAAGSAPQPSPFGPTIPGGM